MNSNNTGLDKSFRFLRVIHSIFLASIPLFILIAIIYLKVTKGVFAADNSFLHIIEIAIGFIAVIVLLMAVFWRRYPGALRTISKVNVTSFHFLRSVYLESIAIYGLVLAILGSKWYIWIWFFVVSAAALVLTFPTDERLNSWTQNQSKP